MTIDVVVNFNVKIKEDILRKIEVIVSEFPQELSGFLIGKFKDENIFIEDIIFPKQTVSGASVDIDAKDVIPLRNDPRWKKLLGLWHSHVSMGTFWSGGEGDESHIRFLSQDKPLSVFIVSSFKSNEFEHKVRVEISSPVKITFDNIPLNVIRNSNNSLKILNEIKGLIKKAKPIFVKSIKDEIKRKYSYDQKLKVLTISHMLWEDYECIKNNLPNEIVIIKTYYMNGWSVEFSVEDKKEVGDIIRKVLGIIKNKEAQQPLYNYNHFRGYFND